MRSDGQQPSRTEVIARAVVRVDSKLLVAQADEAEAVFLPGGHVEPGEPIEQPLRRELFEELGVRAEVGALLGVVENAYLDHGVTHHEVNLVFATTLDSDQVASRESHLRFRWLDLADLDHADLRPAAMTRFVRGDATGTVWVAWRPL